MKTSTLYWFVVGMLCLLLWPTVSAAHGDWRLGQAQARLKAAGFDPGPIDGVLGPRTQAALRRYQASQGLPETGALDDATQRVLLPPERPPERGEAAPGPRPKAPPGGAYQKMSALYQLPDFFSGLGLLYVQPETLPVGPYLAYDRQGNLAGTVYMIPLKELRAGQAFNLLASAQAQVDHVDIYYNNGHPGVPDPHYHVVLWYISSEQAAALE